MRITKSMVDKLVAPSPIAGEKTQVIYRDESLTGFSVRVTSAGVKSFVVEKRIGRKVRRITLGRYPALTAERARHKALELLGEIAGGTDPVVRKKREQVMNITLGEVFEAFLATRQGLKAKTVYDYRRVMAVALGEWQAKRVNDLSKDLIAKRHKQIGEERGAAYANLTMRVLRSVLNFAASTYEDDRGRSILPENPVRRLSQSRAWFRDKRRDRVIKPHQLPAWYQAVMGLEDIVSSKAGVVRDYLLFALFTGLRRQEAARLRWSDIDFKSRTLRIEDTKNHCVHELPLSGFVFDLLERRSHAGDSDFIFAGDGVHGYLVEPRLHIERVRQASGVDFSIHDLRRTFITVAESIDIPAYALKKLLNHKTTSDVTAGYVVIDTERLRAPMEKISAYLLRAMGAEPTAEVLSIRSVN